jgi:outer membrane protein OmpA-like peptidoglycan-associated protein
MPTACRLAVAVVLVVLLPDAARAQQDPLLDGGMDLRLFRPAVDSKGMLTLNGTDILGANDISFGLVLDGGFRLLPFRGFVNDESAPASEARRRSAIVDQLFTGTFHFNYGIANRAVVGVQLPVQILNGPNITIPGQYNDNTSPSGLDYQSIGDVTLHGKVRLLRSERDPIGLAAILHFQFPSGDDSSFAGEPGVAIWPVLAMEWRPVQRFRLAVNAGYRLSLGDGATVRVNGRTEPGSPTGNATGAILDPTAGHDLQYDDLLTFGAGVSFRVAEPIDLVAEVYGTQIVSAFGERGALSMEAIGGIKVFVQRNSYLVIGGGAGFGGGVQAADYRAMLGFIFEPSIGDRDGDGYRDDVDQCPDEPEDFDDFADEDGCPDPDNDRDGILDVDDECPIVPEDRDGDADDDGCPEGGPGDRDGDGILDEVDECPDDPEDRDGFQDEDGCPDPDNDGDGILDPDDLCPDDPEDRDGFEDEDGCPDPDNDQDRILDVNDACPNDPETYNALEDEDGCPDHNVLDIGTTEFTIFEEIYFATDSAQVLPRSFHVLDAIAAAMNGHPEIELVEIEGHADERASDEYNISLTRDRAASVRQELINRGVEAGRMRSVGYGERCPVNPRHNARAWDENRRVEVKILRRDGDPTNATRGCAAARELVTPL